MLTLPNRELPKPATRRMRIPDTTISVNVVLHLACEATIQRQERIRFFFLKLEKSGGPSSWAK